MSNIYSFREQPWNWFYLTYAVISLLLVRLPWWSLHYLLPSQRPRPSWSFKKALMIRLFRFGAHVDYRVRRIRDDADHTAIRGVHGCWVEPVPHAIIGEVKGWAENANLKPIRIPGYWQHKKGENIILGQKPSESERVILYLHGSAYVGLSAHPGDITARISRSLLENIPSVRRVFSPEYRLSSTEPLPEQNPFPAALIDTITAYAYLLHNVGYAPSQVIVVGDSAGGHLALSLCRYLVMSRLANLPPPSGVVLFSPWCDLGGSHDIAGGSYYTRARTDILRGADDPGFLAYATRAFVGPLGLDAAVTNVYISPASRKLQSGEFTGFPKCFIVAGDAEILLDQIRTLVKRMKEDMDTDHVVYFEAKDAVHGFMMMGSVEPQTRVTLRRIAEWSSSL